MKEKNLKIMALILAFSLLLSSCGKTNKKEIEEDAGKEESQKQTSTTNEINKQDSANKGASNTDSNGKVEPESDKDKKDTKNNKDSSNKTQNDYKEKTNNNTNSSSSVKDTNAPKSESNSKTSLSELSEGQTVKINKAISVYESASDAKSKSSAVGTYQAGNYYIYKISNQMVNISLNENEAGGWINPSNIDFEITAEKPASSSSESHAPSNASSSDSQTDDSDSNDSSSPSTGDAPMSNNTYSWSWAYPEEGSSALSNYNGQYKIFGSDDIYLTFDNGYEYQNLTADILDTLANHGVKAVFFVTSSYMRSNPGLVRRMVNEGHIVGNHTVDHLNHSRSSYNEIYNDIKGWESDYRNVVGSNPSVKLFRPPEGVFTETSLKIADDLGYKTTLWSYAYNDWDTSSQPSPNASLSKLLDFNSGGNILLLHAVSSTNAAILGEYIEQTRAQGYGFALLK